jgi:hypothetical protein
VQTYSTTLQQIQQISLGILGDVPYRSRSNGNILRFFNVLQYGNRIP